MAFGGFTERLAILISADAQGAIRELEATGRTAERELGKAGRASRDWSATFTRSGAMLVGAAAVGAVGLSKLAGSASDVEEAQNKVNVVFGAGADDVTSFAENAARSAGLSKAAALDAAGGFGAMFDALGLAQNESAEMSTTLVQLAGDMASFNNQDPTEMLVKLQSGLAGEVEPLRRFGVNLSAAATQAKAMELGLQDANGEISEAAKVQARYQIILEQTSLQQGDFSRTADGMANQQRIMAAEFENLKASIGQGVLPVAKELLGGLNSLVGVFNDLSPAAKETIGRMGALGVGFSGVAGFALLAAGQFLKIKDNLARISTEAPRTATALRTVGGTATVIFGLVAAAQALDSAFGGAQRGVQDYARDLQDLSTIAGRQAVQEFRDLADAAIATNDAIGQDTQLKVFRELLIADEQAAMNLRTELGRLGYDTSALTQVIVETNMEIGRYTGTLDSQIRAAQGSASASSGAGNAAAVAGAQASGAAAGFRELAGAMLGVVPGFIETETAEIDASLAAIDLDSSLHDLDVAFGLAADSAGGGGGGGGGGAAGAVKDFEQAAIDAERQTRSYEEALDGVEDANRALADAEQAVIDARQTVTDATDARIQAEKDLQQILGGQGKKSKSAKEAEEDLERALDDQRRAHLDLFDARDKLAKVRDDDTSSARDIERAELDVAAAEDRLEDAINDTKEARRVYTGIVDGFKRSSDEAKDATERLEQAQRDEKRALDALPDALRGVEDAADTLKDKELDLRQATHDLHGSLNEVGGKAGGGGGSAGRATRSLGDLATLVGETKQKIFDYAFEIANLSGKTEGTYGWNKKFIETLDNIRDRLHPQSPLRVWLNELIADLERLSRVPAHPTLAAGGGGPAGGFVGGFPERQHGGPIPGARNQRMPILAHGGEFVLSADVVDAIKRGAPTHGLTQNAMGFGGTAGTTFNIANLTLPAVTNGQQLVDELVRWSRSNGPLPVKAA